MSRLKTFFSLLLYAHWYQGRYPYLGWVLLPLSWCTGAFWWIYERGFIPLRKGKRGAIPCLVVGNLTLGGSGKSPTVLAIAKLLKQSGLKVGVLSRGYQSDGSGGLVSPEDDAGRVGDEPLLLARALAPYDIPVWVDANRLRGLSAMKMAGLSLAILDDGLQHRRLLPDIALCAFSSRFGVGNGALFPKGPLREPLSALSRMDVLVWTGFSKHDLDTPSSSPLFTHLSQKMLGVRLLSLCASKPAWRLASEPLGWIRNDDKNAETLSLGKLLSGESRDVLVFAGIAHPKSFFSLTSKALKNCPDFSGKIHYLPLADHGQIPSGYLESGAFFLMTEKDAVKYGKDFFPAGRAFYLKIEGILEKKAEKDLCTLVNQALERSKTA